MRHSNQIAVVTGGSQGIGWGIAEKLGKEGARVIIGARKPPTKAFSWEIDYQPLDVADENSIAKFFDNIEKTYGGLDILVNNAGMMFQKHFLDTSVADWDRVMAVNLRGVFICSKYAAELMLKNEGGAIINMGSIEGMAANPDHAPYAASKGGVHGLTRAIAVDMGQYGIRCNAVCPGWIATPLNENYFKSIDDKKRADRALRALHPSGRFGTPADVANLVSWLASDEAAWVTGQEFTVDGGRLARLSSVDFERALD
jgi:meso-butanediol dehydrogenase/(S,S)-butanediol dehydrogenase/diacetyl reductase